MIWSKSKKKCFCGSGFFLEKVGGDCVKCQCRYFGQVCQDSATDCGDTPYWSVHVERGFDTKGITSAESNFFLASSGAETNFYILDLKMKTLRQQNSINYPGSQYQGFTKRLRCFANFSCISGGVTVQAFVINGLKTGIEWSKKLFGERGSFDVFN